MKTHVVKYPGSIKKVLLTMEEMQKYQAHSIISKAGLPEGTLFADSICEKNDCWHTIFTIFLPSGEAFSGLAIRNKKDLSSTDGARCIAADRAVAVWKAQKEVKDKLEFVIKGSFSALFHRDVPKLSAELEKVTKDLRARGRH